MLRGGVRSIQSTRRINKLNQRKSLLVGSIPASDAQQAVELALEALGPELLAIPDGETGERKAWVANIVNGLATNPAVKLKKAGGWTSYDDRPVFKLRRGQSLTADSLELGYHQAYLDSQPVVAAALRDHGLSTPPFQVGIASPFDLALFSLGPIGALRHRAGFTGAAVREVAAVTAEARDDVVFQVELPAELVFVVRSPALVRKTVARWMGRMATEVPRAVPAGARFGIHLCYGDLGNRSLVKGLRDCSAAVELANAITSKWPGAVHLDYVHIPFAAGDEPPTTDRAYYAPLRRLRLPARTRLVAGFVHEALSPAQKATILGLIDEASGRSVDVAAACGLGRRDAAVARSIMESSAVLCQMPPTGS
jgi:hypothetical protein